MAPWVSMAEALGWSAVPRKSGSPAATTPRATTRRRATPGPTASADRQTGLQPRADAHLEDPIVDPPAMRADQTQRRADQRGLRPRERPGAGGNHEGQPLAGTRRRPALARSQRPATDSHWTAHVAPATTVRRGRREAVGWRNGTQRTHSVRVSSAADRASGTPNKVNGAARLEPSQRGAGADGPLRARADMLAWVHPWAGGVRRRPSPATGEFIPRATSRTREIPPAATSSDAA